MSIPSSRLEVATRHGIRPAFRSSSISTRCSRASEPWWARAISSSASSFSRTARRSASRRLLTKTIVERCCLDELEDGRIDRGPDRAGGRLVARRHHDVVVHDGLGELVRGAQLAQVLDGDDDLEVELLARAGVDELDRAVAGDEAADLLERPLRGREADPLRRALEQGIEPLQREREVDAALRACDGVDLVEDHGLDPAQRLAGLRGQHQEERLRRRDQDVGRLLDQLTPLLLGRVAGANADAEVGLDPGERPAQVPLDVVVERLQRRDVEQAEARPGSAIERVDPVQEGGERLAGAGRRLDQDVPAGGDRRPARRLRRRRPGERPLEPAPRLLGERREWIHGLSLARR